MVVLINPNLVAQTNDLLTTGIVYMPVGLAHFAGAVRAAGLPCTVIDALGEAPRHCWREDQFLMRGLRTEDVVARIPRDASAVVLYAINLTYHRALVRILRAVRERQPDTPVIVLENTQAVTAYSLRQVQEEFFDLGASFVITGEGEDRGVRLLRAIAAKAGLETIADIDGIGFRRPDGTTHYTPPSEKIADLDALPWPAWDLFPLQQYWDLKYAHGPFETRRYLPLLTSRGCPYPCRFCVIPETNDVRWRARSAKNVVDEIEHYVRTFGVREFHVEDVDPTVNDARTREICRELIARRLDVAWKVCSGTKVETLKDASTIALMAEAGCRYISISPESGSPKVLKAINKPFRLDHAVRLVEAMNQHGIRSQACFVLGFPGEDDADRRMTWDLVRDLTRVGIDEIALFIITPVPGSAIYAQFSGFTEYSQLNFSPTWREDYAQLNAFRLRLYRQFLWWKLRYHPLKLARQPLNFLRRRFQTKMEMAPYRALHTAVLASRAHS
jgi:radical SAM superfamily enzyme YgiQ (UPF0313 family)